ncbi:MAG TPA: DUF1801 domain-containing protein [Vicinamibacterales bacterium]
MAKSTAANVKEYLAELSPERREFVAALRNAIVRSLPKGYRESMGYGMISYAIPLSRYPKTYNGQPLCYAALASQKGYVALHLMSVYMNPAAEKALQSGFRKAGKKLDKGKACLRFRTLEDVPIEVIEETIGSVSVDEYVSQYEAGRRRTAGARRRAAAATSKTPARPTARKKIRA